MSDNKENIHRRLKVARTALDVSSGDFARKSNIDPRNYSSIESGKRSVGERVLKDICKAFTELNIDWLLTGEGDMLVENAEKREADEKNIVKIPVDVWDVIKDQAESLKSKDKQMDEMLALLKEQKSKDKQVDDMLALLKEQMSKKNAVTVDGVPAKVVAVGE